MHVGVTGAAGFIGSHVVERLLDRGDTVLGLDNFDPFYSPLEKRGNLTRALASPRFRLAEVDLADGPALRSALDAYPHRLDAWVHLAAKAGVRPSIEDPVGYARANVLGTQALLGEAQRRGVRRIVFASSSSVYGNGTTVPFNESATAVEPVSPYAATKRAGELLCFTHHYLYGGSVLCLRFFTVYGPRQRPDLAIHAFARRIVAGEPIELFDEGKPLRDYTYVDDLVDALVRMAGVADDYLVVNLGSDHPVTVSQMVAELERALGTTTEHVLLPAQPGDVPGTHADVSRARERLGWQPTTTFSEGIDRFCAWLRAELAAEGGSPA